MGSAKKRRSDERLVCVAANVPPLIEYRDVYVSYSSSLNVSVASLKDVSDGGIYRIPLSSLGAGSATRVHYQNTAGFMNFSDAFKRTIDQVNINLYLKEGERIGARLEQLWLLLCTLQPNVHKVVIRLSDPEEHLLEVGERIGGTMVYDDTQFFDVAKVTRMCVAFERLELHVKCNAIPAENVGRLIEFFETFIVPRRLTIYISEFKLFLDSISVTENDGRFKTLNAKVKVHQFGRFVTLRIGQVRIQFEDEFQALEFRNCD
ncbi:hypothetical protein PMAYCL1PPCAC_20981 [Pristionchus mayeri]|uniref:Uncharacterized protein n=1 Tax=Pristionchus mayeri TaxID=1317129 RepID=A0AAN5CUC2_9BILA|nr:hypothetical protein PMAYCL1PPCAC_20981 [Pristionchus mayeri]